MLWLIPVAVLVGVGLLTGVPVECRLNVDPPLEDVQLGEALDVLQRTDSPKSSALSSSSAE